MDTQTDSTPLNSESSIYIKATPDDEELILDIETPSHPVQRRLTFDSEVKGSKPDLQAPTATPLTNKSLNTSTIKKRKEKVVASRYMQSVSSTVKKDPQLNTSLQAINPRLTKTSTSSLRSHGSIKSTLELKKIAAQKENVPEQSIPIKTVKTTKDTIKKQNKITDQNLLASDSNSQLSSQSSLNTTQSIVTKSTDQLYLLQNQLLQWCYLNALAHESHDIQENEAQQILLDKWIQTSKLQKELFEVKQEVQQKQFGRRLDESIEVQLNSLQDLTQLASFMENHDQLLQATYSTLHLIPTQGIIADTKSLTNALKETPKFYNQVNGQDVQDINKEWISIGELSKDLDSILKEECAELMRTKELLLALSALENQQQSLLIQQIQLKSSS